MSNQIPPGIEKYLRGWGLIASLLRIAHVFLGSVGLLCPLAIAAFADALSLFQIRLLSFTGATSIALFAGFEIGNLATRFREAWKLLNAAKFKYEAETINLPELILAYEQGEKTIGKMKSDPFESVTVNKVSEKTTLQALGANDSVPQG